MNASKENNAMCECVCKSKHEKESERASDEYNNINNGTKYNLKQKLSRIFEW